MAIDKVIETDILVIGGGMSGFFAAIRAREFGVKVTIAEKAYAGKSGGAAISATHFGVFNPEWGHDFGAWMDFFISVGEYLNDRDWIEVILKESYARYQDLLSWGVSFVQKEHKIASLAFHAPAETSNTVVLVSRQYMPLLRKVVLDREVKVLDRIMITDLLKQGGEIVGAVGFDTSNGDFYTVKAKATIIATGSGSFKAPGDPMYYWTADGEAIGYRAGAELTGKEFGGKDAGSMRAFPSARKAITGLYERYVNAEGEKFTSKYAPKFHNMDRLMISALFEVHAGRAPIFRDFTSNTAEERKGMVEAQRLRGTGAFIAERIGLDLTKIDRFEMMWGHRVGNSLGRGQGIFINTECESTVPGLYAAGDAAGTRLCGSCYVPTGYGLSGAATTGHRAGQSAAQYSLKSKEPIIDQKEVARLKESVYMPLFRKGGFSPGWMTEMLRNMMVPYYIMQIKQGERLQAAITLVKFLENHIAPKLKANDAHELRMAHEVRNMALNAEMMLKASLFRTESRGTHYREDYPRREDPDWLAWTVIKEDQGEMKLFKQPIPKEWWPDLTVPYKERYDLRFPSEL